jgi:hypothetical protein
MNAEKSKKGNAEKYDALLGQESEKSFTLKFRSRE